MNSHNSGSSHHSHHSHHPSAVPQRYAPQEPPHPVLVAPSGARKRPSANLSTTSSTSSSTKPSVPPNKKAATEKNASPPSKSYRGLRHFSMMVCKKVEEKGVTTYNEVADELVEQVITERRQEDPNSKCDEKNIRRRVYDALNVLMAMEIITKNKKAIRWKGLPTSAHADLDMLQREKEYRKQEVERKKEALRELLVQQVCFRNLVTLNYGRKSALDEPVAEEENGDENNKDNHKIPLPFIAVNTHSTAVIQCNMSRDLTDVMFDFSQPFEINDDNTILKRLGMHKTDHETLRQMLPEDLMAYAERNGMLSPMLQDNSDAASASLNEPAPVLAATNDYSASRQHKAQRNNGSNAPYNM